MKCFNYEDIFEKLINDVVCALDNIMTFSYEIYILFNTLKLWFEPIVSWFYIINLYTKGF